MIERVFINLLSKNVANASAFYQHLLGMHLHFESDWFVVLKPSASSPIELGIIDRSSEVVPDVGLQNIDGVYATFVVDDVETTHEIAKEMKAKIIQPPTNMFYGQRRMLIRDLDGLVVDVSSPTN